MNKVKGIDESNNHQIISTMSAKAFFSDKTGECRLEINLPDGGMQGVRFEKTSSLVDYCNHFGIEVSEEDWRTE